MTGTTISTSVSSDLTLTAAGQSPVLVTTSGVIAVPGIAAIYDKLASVATITNLGHLVNQAPIGSGIKVQNAAVNIVNAGGIYGYGYGIYLSHGGTITNGASNAAGGAIESAIYGIRAYHTAATVTNFGAIGGTVAAVQLAAGSRLTNGSTSDQAAIIAGGRGVQIAVGTQVSTITNFGTISGTIGDGIQVSNAAIVVNGPSGASILGQTNGVEIGVAGSGLGTVSNAGTIQGAANDGVHLAAGGSVTNASGGSIAGGSSGVEIDNLPGTVINAGTIAGTTLAGVALWSGGTVVNGSTAATAARISSGNYGLVVGGAAGTVLNFGTIAGDRGPGVMVGGNAWVENWGTIVAGHQGVLFNLGGRLDNGTPLATQARIVGLRRGVDFEGAAGTVTNFGTITTTELDRYHLYFGAIYMGSGGSVTNGNSAATGALIAGDQYGIHSVNSAAATITNFGTIDGLIAKPEGLGVVIGGAGIGVNGGAWVANGSLPGSKALIEGYNGVTIGGIGIVTNWGIIKGLGTVSAGVTLAIGGTVSNGGAAGPGGVITGAVYGVNVAGGAGIVTNSGTISGTGSHGVAIELLAGGTVIDSGVLIGAGGTAVAFGGTAASRLELGAGYRITGLVIGSTGTSASNTLELTAGTTTGKLSAFASKFIDFQTVTVDRGATWALSGLNTIASGVSFVVSGSLANSGTIAGEVTLAAGGRLSNAGRISTVGTAVYGIGGAATVTNTGTITGTGAAGVGIDLTKGGTVINATSGALVTGTTYAIEILGTIRSTVVNFGLISATALKSDASAVDIESSGTVINLHTIEAFGSQGYGAVIQGNGVIVNGGSAARGALIVGNFTAAGVYGGSGTIINFGTLLAPGALGAAAAITGGTVINGAPGVTSAVLSGYYSGVFGKSVDTVSNFGNILGTGAASEGVHLDYTGFVSNNGQIAGGGTGVLIRNSPTTTLAATVVNVGTIAGSTRELLGAGIQMDGNGRVFNGSLLAPRAQITGALGVAIAGAGTVQNRGTIQGFGTAGAGVAVGGGGLVSNGDTSAAAAVIVGTAFGVRITGKRGPVTNFGTIRGSGTAGAGIDLAVGGVVTNGASALTTALITGGRYGIVAGGTGASTVSNFGQVTAGGNPTLAVAVEIESAGTVLNQGIIKATGSGQAIGVSIAGAGRIDNAIGASIVGVSAGAVLQSVATVTNLGVIQATGTAGVVMLAGGTITNGSSLSHGAMISGGTYGVQVTDAPGTLANFATVLATGKTGFAVALGAGGLVTNGASTVAGALIKGGGFGVGLIAGGTVRNFGTIVGLGADGVTASIAGTVVNGSSAGSNWLITGASGVGVGPQSVVTNWGRIIGTTGYGVGLADGGSVTNGSALAPGRTIAGVIEGVFVAGLSGTLSNFGLISASATNGTAVRLFGQDVVINGAGATLSGPAFGLLSSGNLGVSVQNTGTIRGATGLSLTGLGTISNAGVIASSIGPTGTAIALGNAADRLIETPTGTIVGKAVGTAGDTLELAKGTIAGTIAGLGTTFQNFGSVVVDAGASWDLAGANTAAVFSNSGTVAIGAGASLDISGTLNPSATGLFQLETAASLEVASALGFTGTIQFVGTAAPSSDLMVAQASQFGTISGTHYAGPLLQGFVQGDAIDLLNVPTLGLSLVYGTTSHNLTVSTTAAAVATFHFDANSLGAGAFTLTADGHSGTFIKLA